MTSRSELEKLDESLRAFESRPSKPREYKARVFTGLETIIDPSQTYLKFSV